MVRGKKTKGMVMLLLFLGVAIVSAAPTMNDSDGDYVECTWSLSSYAYPCIEQDKAYITGLSNSHLAAVSKEFHKLPVRFGQLSAKAIGVKSLPPAPGTFLMVLVGFLCVSLVKDRRVWLAALAGLLWAGQAGLSLLPQLASNVDRRGRSVKHSSSCSVDCLCETKHPFRLRSHIEGTSYIGLLHHLAGIPNDSTSSIYHIIVRHKLQQGSGRMPLCLCCRLSCCGESFKSVYLQNNFALIQGNTQKEKQYFAKPLHFAITAINSCLIQAVNCFISKTEQHAYFLNAFIIINSARGPPNIGRTRNLISSQV